MHRPDYPLVKRPVWVWSNFGRPIGIEYTRKAAVRAVEEWTEEPWEYAKTHCEVRKVFLVPVGPDCRAVHPLEGGPK